MRIDWKWNGCIFVYYPHIAEKEYGEDRINGIISTQVAFRGSFIMVCTCIYTEARNDLMFMLNDGLNTRSHVKKVFKESESWHSHIWLATGLVQVKNLKGVFNGMQSYQKLFKAAIYTLRTTVRVPIIYDPSR